MGFVFLVEPVAGSALALASLRLGPGEAHMLGEAKSDCLAYVREGSGAIALDGEETSLAPGAAALVLGGEEARLEAGGEGLELLCALAGEETDRHAALGPRTTVVSPDRVDSERATGSRSFRVLLGPHNGSTRATLFLGYVPPGKAPWHYHLYDEIVWIAEGLGRLHRGEESVALGAGSTFRLRPREVHIVENASPDRELTLLGAFTPAGTPAAAYLAVEAGDTRIEGAS